MVDRGAEAGLRRYAWLGMGAIAAFAIGLGGWAATTEIAGAVVANGMVVLEEGSKRVQHPEGGIVDEILVREGEIVEAGELLVRLEGTTAAANLDVIMSQLSEAFAMQARLTAESTGGSQLERPAALADWPQGENLEALFEAQERLRRSRAAAREGLRQQLEEQIAQLEEQIGGLQAQHAAVGTELEIIEAEAEDVEDLLAEGLVQVGRVNTIRRDIARLRGEKGQLTAQIAAARTAIAERRSQIAQGEDEFRSEVLEELRSVGLQIAELLQQKISAEDRLARLEIRAPQSGVVHESIVRTVGGVVGAGETLMLIVPQSSPVLVESRINPIDIDKLYVGQGVAVKFSGFDARTTPELAGQIASISPDLSQDQSTGAQYYSVRVGLQAGELDKLPGGQRLVPGMPAETFMRTADRTVLAYLLDPFARELNLAFRED